MAGPFFYFSILTFITTLLFVVFDLIDEQEMSPDDMTWFEVISVEAFDSTFPLTDFDLCCSVLELDCDRFGSCETLTHSETLSPLSLLYL